MKDPVFQIHHPVDKRTQRTKHSIRRALAQMLSEKEESAITIRDLADRANINRKTFYNYYSGIRDAVTELKKELLDRLDTLFSDLDLSQGVSALQPLLEKFTSYLNSDPEFFSHLFSSEKHPSFISQLVPELKEKAKAYLLSHTSAKESAVEVALDYALTGVIAVLQNWFRTGRKMSTEEISEVLTTMLSGGFRLLGTENS